MKSTLSSCLLLFIKSLLLAQVALSGVINQYAAVTDINSCAGTLTVSDARQFSPNGDILIIQMQGATINISNNVSFGNIQELRSAGLFERARIRSISGNVITLENTLINSYNLDGAVQIVSLPVYENATVVDSIVAAQWNGSTGGVLALEVINRLTLNGNISAHGRGFRGGIADIAQANSCSFISNQDAYFYGANNWRGAAKGEGIARMATGREAGRGAQANGGGGGNDHNAGGGGGANFANGGRGGNNQEPSALGCDGRFPGLGGKALPESTNRLFMGGGGGAGHENNKQGTNGGNGGGIVILLAGTIVGNNRIIDVQGSSISRDANGDGAGGGGAGGTALVLVSNLQGSMLINARGGNGGNVNNSNGARCHGPGGGGSGGVILSPTVMPINLLVPGGNAGRTLNSSVSTCPDGNNGATRGGDGLLTTPITIPRSMEIPGDLRIINQPDIVEACPGRPLSIFVQAAGVGLKYQWQINQGSSWQNLTDNAPYFDTRTAVLRVNQVTTSMAAHLFRLIISSSCSPTVTSAPIRLRLTSAPTAGFTMAINGFQVQFNNSSTNATRFRWDFGDGNGSTEANPTHTYATDGDYIVRLTAISDCDSAVFVQNVSILSTPTAGFKTNTTRGCAPLEVAFQNTSSPNATSFAWILPGATPAVSNQRNPAVRYNFPGVYSVTLIASNAAGLDTLRREAYIEVLPGPTPNFTTSINELLVTFVNTSNNAASFRWDFGDGNTSTAQNPTHRYATSGTRIVTLTAVNECGSQTISRTITVGLAPNAAFTQNRRNGCAPHLVTFADRSSGDYTSRQWSFPGGNPSASTDTSPTVRYDTPGQYNVSLTVSGPLGSSTITQEAYITVLAQPMPAFDLSVNGTTVRFQNASVGATSLLWNFGDGSTSTAANPTHTYAAAGVYTVTLNASNAYCGRSTTRTIAVGVTAASDLRQSDLSVFPNPIQETLYIQAETFEQTLNYQLFDLGGRLLLQGQFNQRTALNCSAFAKGIYLLKISHAEAVWIVRILKNG